MSQVSPVQNESIDRHSMTAVLREKFAARSAAAVLGPHAAEFLYSLAYRDLENGLYEASRERFFLLVSYRPLEQKYWLGYGIALKMLQRYDEAILAYSMIEVLFPGSPSITLKVAECQLLKGETDKAAETLQLVIEYCATHEGFASVDAAAKAMSVLVSSRS